MSKKTVILRPEAEGSRARSFVAPLGLLRMTLLCFVILSLSGCGTDWEKKFIRRRIKPPRPPQFEVEAMQRPYPELYKEHFNYWKNAHRQLTQDLGGNHKRELQQYRASHRHLMNLQKYLQEVKAKQAAEFAERFDRLTLRLKEGRMAQSDYGLLKQQLEALEVQIDRALHPKKMKDFLLPTPTPMDLNKYQGEEPILPKPVEIKPEPAEADSQKDGSGSLSYEKFRTLPVQ